jgi:hypothetical protein
VRLRTVPLNSQVWSFLYEILLFGFLPAARTGGTEQALPMRAWPAFAYDLLSAGLAVRTVVICIYSLLHAAALWRIRQLSRPL